MNTSLMSQTLSSLDRSPALLAVEEALASARTRDDVRTVELTVLPHRMRVRVAKHQHTQVLVCCLQSYNEARERWEGRTLRWAKNLRVLRDLLDSQCLPYLDQLGWCPVYFSFAPSSGWKHG